MTFLSFDYYIPENLEQLILLFIKLSSLTVSLINLVGQIIWVCSNSPPPFNIAEKEYKDDSPGITRYASRASVGLNLIFCFSLVPLHFTGLMKLFCLLALVAHCRDWVPPLH